MLRLTLLLLLVALVGRAFWKLMDGVLEALRGDPMTSPRASPRAPQRGVPMARDPVCGTFVVPERAIPLTTGGQQLFFCSVKCRDAFQTRTA